MKGYIFDIQKCSIHDGPGIRTTVFLKGCPLSCQWCHNAESQSANCQLRFIEKRCINCQKCTTVCSQTIHLFEHGKHKVKYDLCVNCGRCIEVCPTQSLSIYGKLMTAEEVVEIVKKDIPFYTNSNGGVTISGGEPLMQSDFTMEILKQCKELGIHTCIETSGFGSLKQIEKVAPYVDLFLFDYKVSNDEEALKYIGVDTRIIYNNLDTLIRKNHSVILRCPIIPTVNDKEHHYDSIIELLQKYPSIKKAELMAYHNTGISKAHQVGIQQKEFPTMTDEDKEKCIEYFNNNNINNISFSS